jgi:ferric-dicitrate binding protein FerR (iron transport regulator)
MNKSVFINYFKGELTEKQEKDLLDWVEQSEENYQELLKERKLWDILILSDASKNKESESEIQQSNRFRRVIYNIGKVAAIFIVAFGLGILFKTNSGLQITTTKFNKIEVPRGQRVLITLVDGTKVWLNAKSKFTFPDHFEKNNRTVQLDGEAYFDVVHNEKDPFIVKTSKYQIKVLGTQFNVNAYQNSNNFETTLVEGRVLLKTYDPGSLTIELKPDEQYSEDSGTGKYHIKKVVAKENISWIDGVYTFNDQSFSDIVQRLERYYDTKIVVNYPELLDYRFTGKFRYRDSLTMILDVVKQNKAFTYKQVGNKIIINR